LEKSKRGGHLWIFFERPVLARDARIYIYHVAGRLDVQVKGAGLSDGIEIFPKQDELRPDEFGNAIRAPLGVHWGARESRGWRYWYYGADYTLDDQLAYLRRLPKVKEQHLRRMIAGKTIPQEFAQRACRPERPKYLESKPGEFRILEYVEVRRQVGRNWVARCPSCASHGHDKAGDNLGDDLGRSDHVGLGARAPWRCLCLARIRGLVMAPCLLGASGSCRSRRRDRR